MNDSISSNELQKPENCTTDRSIIPSQKPYTVYKAAAVILGKEGTAHRRLLVTHAGKHVGGKKLFVLPGGKLEAGETSQGALRRELEEELRLAVHSDDLYLLGTFYDYPAGSSNPDAWLRMDVYIVHNASDISPTGEIQEMRWISSVPPEDIVVGSITVAHILLALKARDLID